MRFNTYPDSFYSMVVGEPSAVHNVDAYSSQSQPYSSLLPHHVQVAFKISYEHHRQYIGCLHDGSTTFLGGGPPSRQQRSCILDLRGFMKESNTSYATLADKLLSFGIQRQKVHKLIDRIFFHGHRILGSQKDSNVGRRRSSVIPIHVEIIRGQTFRVNYERYLMHRALRESMVEFETRNYGMVPASESSLKNMLKRVKVAAADVDVEEEKSERKRRRVEISSSSSENCSICLEEVEAGSYGTSMPCSHMFHSGCIVKWLKQSHYCPVCRYEMPTTN